MGTHVVLYNRPCLRSTVAAIMVVAMTLVLAVAVPGARAAMTLDQQHLLENGAVFFDDTQRMAQTFTPAITGQLAQVEVKAWDDGGYPATMSIQTVANSMPSGTVLGSADIPVWTPNAWNSADFLSQSIWLTAGQQYAIVLSGSEVDAWNSIAVNWLHADAYPGGQVWAHWWSGAESWSAYAPDAAFQTWMDTPTVIPVPGSILLASIGAGVLSHLRRRRLL